MSSCFRKKYNATIHYTRFSSLISTLDRIHLEQTLVVRYCGIFNLIVSSLEGSTFLPGLQRRTYLPYPPCRSRHKPMSINSCQIIGIINGWTFLLFFGAADFVMILRVWTMYNWSRLILGTLLMLFSAVIIATFLIVAIGSVPKNLSESIIQLADSSFCVLGATIPTFTDVAVILQITQGGVMCTLAIVQIVRQSLQMYRATKQWQLSRYMAMLVKQGILSFLAVFLFDLANVLSDSGDAPTGGWQLLLCMRSTCEVGVKTELTLDSACRYPPARERR
ncbi:hypothetical protein HD554DRAFT_1062394 [Boletus coccyginus]|nr:hypothetical protein HD554DRAFT_1062394 [Boletus coccyginus]